MKRSMFRAKRNFIEKYREPERAKGLLFIAGVVVRKICTI